MMCSVRGLVLSFVILFAMWQKKDIYWAHKRESSWIGIVLFTVCEHFFILVLFYDGDDDTLPFVLFPGRGAWEDLFYDFVCHVALVYSSCLPSLLISFMSTGPPFAGGLRAVHKGSTQDPLPRIKAISPASSAIYTAVTWKNLLLLLLLSRCVSRWLSVSHPLHSCNPHLPPCH